QGAWHHRATPAARSRRRGHRMRRRELIAALGGAAMWPRAVHAQRTPDMKVIGFLSGTLRDSYSANLEMFRKGLSETGYVENRNVRIEYRWAEGRYEQLPELVADLVAHHVNVIVATGGNPPAQAAKAATTTIPIVFLSGGDPISGGLVSSLNRPSGNITG